MTATSPSVLLVDNDRALHESLVHAGWRCSQTSDASSIVEKVSTSRFDLVVLDAALPRQPLDLITALQHVCPEQALLVVVAERTGIEEYRAFNRGLVGVIERPHDPRVLRDELERRISKARQREFENRSYRFVVRQHTEWRFQTSDLSVLKFRLPVLDELEQSGLLVPLERQRFELALDEALANSIEHGNLELKSPWREEYDGEGRDRYSSEKIARLADPRFADRFIAIACEISSAWLTVAIQDAGEGFQPPESGASSTTGRQVPNLFGRGLPLIQAGVDELFYEEGGRKIVMKKRLNVDEGTQ